MLLTALGAAAVFMAPALMFKEGTFNVIILEESDGQVSYFEETDFKGGYFQSPAGEKIPLIREEKWGDNRQMFMKRPTLLINKTSRLILLKSFSYSTSGYGPDSAYMPLFPAERISTPVSIFAIEPEDYISPSSIQSSNFDETLVIALYSLNPYNVEEHGTRENIVNNGESWIYEN